MTGAGKGLLAGFWVGLLVWAVDLPAGEAAPPGIDWLEGSWCDGRNEERWWRGPGDLWLGVSRTVVDGRSRAFEFLRIERERQGWTYVAQPGGRAPTQFAQVSVAAEGIDFANPQHDFPQRIRYWREGDALLAEIAGSGKTGERSQRFRFRRGACAEDAVLAVPDGPIRTMGEILESAPAEDWRALDPARLLLMEFAGQRVVIELAPAFAPRHVENVLKLVRGAYFDGLAILRVQDNFVVQWGDPAAEDEEARRPTGAAQRKLAAEFTRPASADLDFLRLPDVDGYAPEVGFSQGMAAARDPRQGRAWLAHCYGTLGVGRDNEVDSGGGAELYVVIGQAPRQLDRNITTIGRVVQGMEALASLPRGSGPLGFYADPAQRIAMTRIRVVADLDAEERPRLQALRTDSASFAELVESRRNRRDPWYKLPAGHIDLCQVPLPVREAP